MTYTYAVLYFFEMPHLPPVGPILSIYLHYGKPASFLFTNYRFFQTQLSVSKGASLQVGKWIAVKIEKKKKKKLRGEKGKCSINIKQTNIRTLAISKLSLRRLKLITYVSSTFRGTR